MKIKKVTVCPKKKTIKPKSKTCKKCEFYNSKKWYSAGKEVEVFCTFGEDDYARSTLRKAKPPKKKSTLIDKKPKK